MSQKPLTYVDAGVDIEAGEALVDRIKPIAKATTRPEVLGNLGGFGGLFSLPTGYKEPVLVSGTDGVGTKLKLALELQKHDTIGIDLVAMCVNDLVVTGAEPLFFLDYYASSKLDVDIAADVIQGIGDGCQQAGCALIGGETAEMPGLYHNQDYDLAGFCVGIVEKSEILNPEAVQPGQKLLALASSGAHSNGFSLIRKIIEVNQLDLGQSYFESPQANLGLALLEPTKIYIRPLLEMLKTGGIKAMAHITGGGITENLPRVLPKGCIASIDTNSWETPALFQFLQQKGQIETEEMLKTFNMGAGMILVVDEDQAQILCDQANALGETAWIIGELKSAASDAAPRVEYQ